MKRHRLLYPILYIFAIISAGLVVFLHIHTIKIEESENPYNFSAANVAKDIKIISKKPHSIEHPNERKFVRDYLSYRLRQLGAQVKIFEYDSIASRLGGYIEIANIYAAIPPPQASDSTGYLLLIAHYDSSFRHKVLSDTLFSYGAADNGYGLGVILELIRVANNYHNLWNQGIKVLFTDAEENRMDGMRSVVDSDPQLLENVNLVINIDARGVRGPALLFETSDGNGRLIDFYKKAGLPYGYSLTSLVYRILPNNTDFSLVKENYPGYNFAVVDNLKFYHTDRDNYSNISLKSIQHYGKQINPLVKSYLLGKFYGKECSFKANCNKIFFTIPLLGLFSFSRTGYMAINIITLLFTLFLIFIAGKMFKVERGRVFEIFRQFLFLSLFVLLVGIFAACIVAFITGVPFHPLEIRYFKYDNLLFISLVVVLALELCIHVKKRDGRDGNFCSAFMVSQLLFMWVLTFISALLFLDNFLFLVPLAMANGGYAISLLSPQAGRVFYLFSAFVTALLGFSFFYLLYVTVTIGSAGFLLFLITPFIGLLVAQLLCAVRLFS